MRRVCVTGAAGKVGRAVVTELLEHKYHVTATDLVPAPELPARLLLADLRDYGQALEAMSRADAVVHAANIPAPGLRPPAVTFVDNTTMNHHVFAAAAQLGLSRVVWTSSETVLGLPFATSPRYAPLDEDHAPLPTSTYALSKVVAEAQARHYASWTGIPFVGLRLSNVFDAGEYPLLEAVRDDPVQRRWNLWGYVDARDAAQACRLALEADCAGAHEVIVAAADTVSDRPSSALLAEFFPDVPIRRALGESETLLSIDRARQLLGYAPRHSWREA